MPKTNPWRDLAIALAVVVAVLFAMTWVQQRDYLELYRSGVERYPDVVLLEYYESIISNRCQIVERGLNW